MAWGRYAVGGRRLDFASRSSVPFYLSRSAVRSISPYRIEAGQCAPFLPARFLVSSVDGGSVSFSFTRYARPFVSFLFSSCPSRGASRGCSLRFALRLVLSRQFAGVSSLVSLGGPSFVVRLARRFSVFRLARLIVCSSRPLVSSSSPCSLVSPGGSSWRLVVRFARWRPVFSVSFFSVLVSSRSLRLMWPWRRQLVFLISWRRALVPVASRRGIRLG